MNADVVYAFIEYVPNPFGNLMEQKLKAHCKFELCMRT